MERPSLNLEFLLRLSNAIDRGIAGNDFGDPGRIVLVRSINDQSIACSFCEAMRANSAITCTSLRGPGNRRGPPSLTRT